MFYQVGERYWQTYLDMGLTLVKGEEAIVPLEGFTLEGHTGADLRQAWNRGKRGGLSFRMPQNRSRRYCRVWPRRRNSGWKKFAWQLRCAFPDVASRWRWPAEGQIRCSANVWWAPAGSANSRWT
ncbi:phosphatidylglycerol lysyltransferase domain-containing protein [Xanthomonas axonopodis]